MSRKVAEKRRVKWEELYRTKRNGGDQLEITSIHEGK